MVLAGLLLIGQPLSAMQQKEPQKWSDQVHLFFQNDSNLLVKEAVLSNKLGGWLKDLESLRSRKSNDLIFLKKVFYRTHRELLHQYNPAASVPQTLETGKYGCMSGTALYAIILNHFDFDFEIIETTGHVYLQVNLDNRKVLFESTLATDGFITNVRKIARATQQYSENSRKNTSLMTISGIGKQTAGVEIYAKRINLKELSGLQYYNTAIFDMGDEAFDKAYWNAEKSVSLYPCKRTKKLMEIVINKILQSKSLTRDQKSGILKTYISQIKKKRLTQRPIPTF